jgi:hypothetical protein
MIDTAPNVIQIKQAREDRRLAHRYGEILQIHKHPLRAVLFLALEEIERDRIMAKELKINAKK